MMKRGEDEVFEIYQYVDRHGFAIDHRDASKEILACFYALLHENPFLSPTFETMIVNGEYDA
jgi:hypothetical protein